MSQENVTFGCAGCWPSEASAASVVLRAVPIERHLVDASHLGIAIRGCTACGQRFVAIFTETIDWADGQDPQEWSVLPLTPDEVSRLVAMDPATVEGSLHTFGMGRRSFLWRNPKGGPETAEWSFGASVGLHD